MWVFFANVANKVQAACNVAANFVKRSCNEVAKFYKKCYEKFSKKVKNVIVKAKRKIDEGIKKINKRVSRIFTRDRVEGISNTVMILKRIGQLAMLIGELISPVAYVLGPVSPTMSSIIVIASALVVYVVMYPDEARNALFSMREFVVSVGSKKQSYDRLQISTIQQVMN